MSTGVMKKGEVTTDFQSWLDGCDLGSVDGYEDVYCLYRAIQECEGWGRFTCTKHDASDKWFVQEDGGDVTLLLASVKARDFFLKHLVSTNCDDMDMEGWYAFHHAMSKND